MEVKLCATKVGGESRALIKHLRVQWEKEEGTSHHPHRACPSLFGEHVYLVKTALSFLASTVSRMVSLPAPVVMVSVVTVSLDVDSVLPSSSSLSELLEEELSDATSGAFLATHTLHTQAAESEEEMI